MMKTVTAVLESIEGSSYSQSRPFDPTQKPKDRETPQDFELRTWRERCNYDETTGMLFIPPMAFKNCMSEIAKYLSIQIPGKGKSTYTKHFEAGLMVMHRVPLSISKDEVKGQWLYVPSNGVRGGSHRVWKCFPVIPYWKAPVTFLILDDAITLPVFEQHLREAGNFIGIGRFRPRNNGFYGRFKVLSIDWV
jgi:hypothetical protein